MSTATCMPCHAFACVCTARPSTRAISPKTPRMEASAREMPPICSLPVLMPMKRSASLLSMAPRTTKTTGSWSVRRIHAWPTSHRTARRSPGRNAGHILAPVRCQKSELYRVPPDNRKNSTVCPCKWIYPRPQNKKDRTITLRVGYEVAEGAVGNADNDQVNCYQTVIKSWKSALRWMGYLS